ncbi:hypothetical protein [Jannaschia pohangensis]|uniref:Type IV pilus biogenesis protein PilP n=1 Tax=Jannaschia pohangensis TaxID=390807 RepID=A0A1I3JGJ2_9RHOB|nr:hypothetical protein [Jannaschia pohangensis]SFI59230.1 hypothetical protein SAMN04488095_1314 [Jannaschia pohangensis]
MTPLVALDLSLDGISVLTRAPEGPDHGKWYREGVVRLDAPDMAETLGRLRDKCAERVGGDFTSILIIPDSQILFTSLERDDRKPEETIRSLLRGRTPYDVEDLTFDFVQRGDRLQVAVIALETLLEAETFAADFGFRPVTLIGNPTDSTYPGRPDFGKTGIATELLAGDSLSIDLGETIDVIAAPAPAPLPEAIPAPKAPTPAHAVAGDPAGRARVVDTRPAQIPPAPPPRAADAPVMAAPVEAEVPEAPEDLPTEAAEFAALVDDTPTAEDPMPETAGRIEDEDVQTEVVKAEDVSPPASTPVAEDHPTLSDALAAPDTTEDEGVEPELPVFSHSPKPLVVAASDVEAPRFTTKRRSEPTLPTEPVLTRIAPRLSAPVPVADRIEPTVSAPSRPAEVSADPVDTPPVPRPALTTPPHVGTTPPPRPKTMPPIPLSTLAEGLGAPKRPEALADATSDAPRKRLAGLMSGTKVRATPKVPSNDDATPVGMAAVAANSSLGGQRGGSARMGLYLTLSLLALLAMVGLGSAFFLPGDDPRAVAELIETETSTNAPQDDVAMLLPEPGTQPGVSVASPIPDLVTPPQPIPGESPEELAEAGEDVPVEALPEALADAATFAATPDLAPSPTTGDAQDIDLAQVDSVITSASATSLPTTVPPLDVFAPQQNPAPAGADVPVATAPIEAAPETPTVAEVVPEEVPAETPPVETAEAAEPAAEAQPDLVVASAEGTLAPGGYRVVLGQPAVLPTRRPGSEAAADETTAEVPAELTEEETALLRVRPVQRPGDAPAAEETAPDTETEDPLINGLSREELLRIRPRIRPAGISEAAAEASAEASAEELAAANRAREAEIAEQNAAIQAAAASAAASLAQQQLATSASTAGSSGSSSPLALALSERPRTRPRSVERDAARIVTQRREQATAASASTATASASNDAPVQAAPRSDQTIRSSGGSVARAATQTNQIRLRDTNLIGVYGRPNARRALVRLGNGRYVKVEVGDRLERGRVTAIGESELVYQRGGRSVTLRLPRA